MPPENAPRLTKLADAVAWSPAVIQYQCVAERARPVPGLVLLANGHEYAFEYCRRDGALYYREVGSGPPPTRYCLGRMYGAEAWPEAERVPIWCAESVRLVDDDGAPADLAALGYRRLADPVRPDPFEDASDCETVWCAACEDWLPDDGWVDPCPHLWWCSQTGMHCTNAAFENYSCMERGPCDDADCPDCEPHRPAADDDSAASPGEAPA